MRQSIIKIIPDKIFYKIYRDAETMSQNEYLSKWCVKKASTWDKLNIPSDTAYTISLNIYKLANISINALIEYLSITKQSLSYRYCVPIQTINSWLNGSRRCSAVFKLSVIRDNGLFFLSDHVFLESDYEKPLYTNKDIKSRYHSLIKLEKSTPESTKDYNQPINELKTENSYFEMEDPWSELDDKVNELIAKSERMRHMIEQSSK